MEKRFYCLVLCLFLLAAVLFFSSRNNDRGTESVKQQINSAGELNSRVESGIEHATDSASKVEGRITDSEKQIELIERKLTEAERINRECQQLIETVRRRAKERNQKD